MKKLLSAGSAGAVSAVTLVSILAVPSSYAAEEIPVLASADASESGWGDSSIDVNRLEVSEDGGYATLTYTVHYEGSGRVGLVDFQNTTYLYTAYGHSGVVLVDEENGFRYNPAFDSTGQCMCAVNTAAPEMARDLESGDSATYWASYLISEDTTSVNVEVPGFDPVADIPIE
ncbi:hypothetical protein ACFO4E_02370 [Nocardiopsis mangrovi]|uniref:Uncharacterized protein n=1 Tax=Nocardiopsis mangrovi TaxID=1179818 RepID=A0ABV9DPJ6_9ACTN